MASGSGGIQFNGDTAAANALDDYEEGTWTPAYASSNGDLVVGTYSSQSGKYIKVGNLVTVLFRIGASSITATGTGNILITGLPFTPTAAFDGATNIKALVFNQYGGWNTIPGQVGIYNTTSMLLYDNTITSNTPLTTAAFSTQNVVRAAITYLV
jgi:hypothetical protein